MAVRCSSEQLSEALILWCSQTFETRELCMEREDADDLKPLDLLISTVDIFFEGFKGDFHAPYDKHKKKFILSKKKFIDYLKPRCLLLARNNDCFDFILTCSFVYDTTFSLSCDDCCHLSRVASKLLASVLEDKFFDMLNTDFGWEELMSYCRKIHGDVFPSRENRPPGYDDIDFKNKIDKSLDSNECEINEEFIEQNESRESSGEEDSKLLGQTISKEITEENPIRSVVFEDLPDTEVLDTSDYWYFGNMSSSTICERITSSQEHLKNVLNLIELMEQDMDLQNLSSNKYDLSVSDDEDIENFERRLFKPDLSDWKIRLSDGTLVDFATYEICLERNEALGDSSQNPVRYEDITDEERRQFSKEFFESDEEPLCELCEGRKIPFYRSWLKRFKNKYTNFDFVSDCDCFIKDCGNF